MTCPPSRSAAMAYGAFGSLASRAEDAANAAEPVPYALLAAYPASCGGGRQQPRQHRLETGLPLPGHRTLRHARAHRPRRRHLVGAHHRHRPHPRRHRPARRARLHHAEPCFTPNREQIRPFCRHHRPPRQAPAGAPNGGSRTMTGAATITHCEGRSGFIRATRPQLFVRPDRSLVWARLLLASFDRSGCLR